MTRFIGAIKLLGRFVAYAVLGAFLAVVSWLVWEGGLGIAGQNFVIVVVGSVVQYVATLFAICGAYFGAICLFDRWWEATGKGRL